MSDLEDIAAAAQQAGGHPIWMGGYRQPGTERVWTIHDQGQQLGPHTEVEMATLLASGNVSATALVWREGSPRWIPITAVVPLPGATLPYAPAYVLSRQYPSSGTKIAAGILGILLGCLGIHKFVLGFVGAGLVMLLVSVLTCGYAAPIMAIIGLIEGIIYLSKSDAQFHQDYVVNKRSWF